MNGQLTNILNDLDKFIDNVQANREPEFYYQWGNEDVGYVSTGMYDENEVYHFTGYFKKQFIIDNNIPFHNPHN